MNEKELPDGFTLHEDRRSIMVICKECGDAFKQAFRFRVIEPQTDDPRDQYPDICRECASKEPITVEKYFDGAKSLEYPVKEEYSDLYTTRTYKAYDDCDNCGGSGRVFEYVDHRFTHEGIEKEPKACRDCSDRFHNHPLREAKSDVENELRDKLNEYYNGIFEDRLEQRGLTPHDVDEIQENHEDLMDHLSGLLKGKRKELEEILDQHFEEAIDMETKKGVEHIKKVKKEFNIKQNKPDVNHEIPKNTKQDTLI